MTIVASLELRAEKEKIDREKTKKYWAEQKKLKDLEEKCKAIEEVKKARISLLLDHSALWHQ